MDVLFGFLVLRTRHRGCRVTRSNSVVAGTFTERCESGLFALVTFAAFAALAALAAFECAEVLGQRGRAVVE